MTYSLEVKQLVRFPYCRIYRSFANSIVRDPQIRKHGGALLFYFVALFTLANYRRSYRTLDGERYSIKAGEWIARRSELCERLCLRRYGQVAAVLHHLEELHCLSYTEYPRQKLVRFRILCWQQSNTTLDYSAPCQKDLGFIFFPVSLIEPLIGAGRCSEADMLLDLWMNAVFNDTDVVGSEVCPLVYFRNEDRLPLLNYAMLARRWRVSKATVYRTIKKLEQRDMLLSFSFPGTAGSVICLRSYLSTMFCVADPHPDKAELALHLRIDLPQPPEELPGNVVTGTLASVSESVAEGCGSVSNPNIRRILDNVRKGMYASGFSCSACPHALYRLSCLSGCEDGTYRYDLAISCGDAGPRYLFNLTLRREIRQPDIEVEVI